MGEEQDKKRRAIVMGINKYEHKEMTELEGAEKDAQEFFEIITDPVIGGFEIKKGRTFLTGKQATIRNIRRAISEVFIESQNQLVLFYFSGHGLTSEELKDGFLAPWDVDPYHPFSGIRLSELKEIIHESVNPEKNRSRNALAILDCCYSGQMTEGGKMFDADEAGIVFEKRLGEFEPSRGVFVLASSRAKEQSREIPNCHKDKETDPDGHSHGLMTYHLLDALSGKASHDKGKISLYDIATYVNQEVTKAGSQKCMVNFSGAFDITKLQFIVSDSNWVETRIADALTKTGNCYDSKSLVSLLAAQVQLNPVLERWPGNKKAKHWKQKIDKSFKNFKAYDELKNWLLKRFLELKVRLIFAYPILEKMVITFPLDYEKAAKFDDNQRGLLGRLYQASRGDITQQEFILFCEAFNINPVPSAKQPVAPLTSADSEDSFSEDD